MRADAFPAFRAHRSQFDADRLMCNLQDAVLIFDKDTGAMQVREPSIEDMNTFAMPVKYDPNATCPKFEAFLEWMIPSEEQRIYLQQYIGLCLTGLTERAFVVFVGQGRNGKTVLQNLLAGFFGPCNDAGRISRPYHIVAGMNTLTSPDETAGSPRADLERLDAVRVINVSESNDKDSKNEVKFNMAFIKRWTGGDTAMAVRGLYQAKMKDCRPYGKFFIYTNHIPKISENTEAAWERIKIIRCNSRVSDSEKIDHYEQRLLTERSGILNWALRGLQMYFENGQTIKTPPSMMRAVEEQRVDDDPVRQFVLEVCDVEGGGESLAKDLHRAFMSWHGEELGICNMKVREFTARLESVIQKSAKRKKDGKYLPLALKEECKHYCTEIFAPAGE